MGGSSKPPAGANGYRYYFDLLMGIGRGPVDELVEIRVGDRLAWQGSMTNTGVSRIVAPELFGGEKKEGGIVGDFRLMMGDDTQLPFPEVTKLQPGNAQVAFRRRVLLFYTGLVCSVNPYPKAWSLRIRRAVRGWDGPVFQPEHAVITLGGAPPGAAPVPAIPTPPATSWRPASNQGGIANAVWGALQAKLLAQGPRTDQVKPNEQIKAMNPAHIVYECLTNREWGRGLPRSSLDQQSFSIAAAALFNEQFGLCIKWSRRDGIDTFIQSVLDHIGATLYTDRETSLMKIFLIRGDYDRNALPLYTTSNGILEFSEASAATNSSAVNEVVVTYRDPVMNEDRTVRAQNLAILQSTGGAFNSLAKSYLGCPTDAIARRLAQRDLRANADGLRRFQLKMDRRAWRIAPGSVIRIEDVPRKIFDMVVRVARVEDGTLTNGPITLTVVQDVFSLPATTFTGNQPNTWERPSFEPCIGLHKVFEVPYFLLANTLTPAALAGIAPSSAFLGTVAEKAQTDNVSYDIAVRSGAVEEEDWPENDSAYCGYVPPL
jgi:hypothetical protein